MFIYATVSFFSYLVVESKSVGIQATDWTGLQQPNKASQF